MKKSVLGCRYGIAPLAKEYVNSKVVPVEPSWDPTEHRRGVDSGTRLKPLVLFEEMSYTPTEPSPGL